MKNEELETLEVEETKVNEKIEELKELKKEVKKEKTDKKTKKLEMELENVIKKAIDSCESVGISAFKHFVGVDKTIQMPKAATKKVKEYRLTRYACYLIAQNGD